MTKQIEITLLPDGRMDTDSAAAYVGNSTKTLAMHRTRGTGPRFVKRGRIYYYKADLDDWLLNGRASSTAEARLQRKPDALQLSGDAPRKSSGAAKAETCSVRSCRAKS